MKNLEISGAVLLGHELVAIPADPDVFGFTYVVFTPACPAQT